MTKQKKQYDVCPKCGSDNLDYNRLEGAEDYAWRAISCMGCNFEWQEVYEFIGNETPDTCDELDDEGNIVE